MLRLVTLSLWLSMFSSLVLAEPGNWPQFRGPNGAGLAVGNRPLPDKVGPEENVIWKTALPPGHSSPAIFGDRVYVTAIKDQTLLTIALDRESGRVLWEYDAPYQKLEEVHRIGNRAQPSPATDGKHVVSFFGSCGLFCYDTSGKKLWDAPLGPFKNEFGAGSSPMVVDGRVLLNQDHDLDSALMCFDAATGKKLWTADRSEFPRGYASPMIWEVEGKKQVVVAGCLRVVGYDWDTGREVWTVRGLARVMNMTPVVTTDGTLVVGGWAAGAEADDLIRPEPFPDMLAAHDKNKNGTIESGEMPKGALSQRYSQIDRDKDGHITRDEYENMKRIFEEARNLIVAIKPGGKGDVTETHVLWKQERFLPYIPSPLYVDGHVYMVKDGGIFSCLDAKTGKPAKQGRVAGTDSYYASPVYGDGKIYTLCANGQLTVLKAGPQWSQISTAKFEEEAYATPALVDGRIYVRTAGHLYCFGLTDAK